MADHRKPLLIDIVRQASVMTHPRLEVLHSKIVDQLMQAKAFVLDSKAVQYLGEYVRDYPEMIPASMEFAIPPFKVMWVEFNLDIWFEAIHGVPLDRDGDEYMGFLFSGNLVYSFVRGKKTEKNYAVSSPLVYRLNAPASLEEEVEFCRVMMISRMQIDSFMWGTVGPIVKEEHPELYYKFRANHAVLAASTKEWKSGQLSEFYEGAAGDLRNIVSLLVFLNRTSDMQYVKEVKASPGLINRKPSSFKAHSVISFSLNPVPRLKKIGAEGIRHHKRLHDVRGHFCRNKDARDAELEDRSCADKIHDWQEVIGSKHRDQVTGALLTWRCGRCGGKKWFKASHKRGSLKEGLVVQEYSITAN